MVWEDSGRLSQGPQGHICVDPHLGMALWGCGVHLPAAACGSPLLTPGSTCPGLACELVWRPGFTSLVVGEAEHVLCVSTDCWASSFAKSLPFVAS